MISTTPTQNVLEGQEAVDLWLKGKDAWNKYVKENNLKDIVFSSIDFSTFRHGISKGKISFIGYSFDNANVHFKSVNFGNGGVEFRDCIFGNGEIIFDGANFGTGSVIFKCNFGQGLLSFNSVNFGEGRVSFRGCALKNGKIRFHRSNTKCKSISFTRSYFTNVDIDLSLKPLLKTKLDLRRSIIKNCSILISNDELSNNESIIDFSSAEFYESSLSFHHCRAYSIILSKIKAENSTIDLSESILYCSELLCKSMKLLDTEFLFTGSEHNLKKVIFDHSKLSGNLIFEDEVIPSPIEELSFKGVSFNDVAIISGKFNTAIDLTSTQKTNHIDLSALHCSLPRVNHLFFFKKSINHKDSSKLRRLKELSEDNKHHDAALKFHAEEMRAERWHELSCSASILDMAFSAVCNYGQSIFRPFACLVLSWLFFALVYTFPLPQSSISLQNWIAATWNVWTGEGMLLSLASSIPFVPIARSTHTEMLKSLYGTDVPIWVTATSFLEGVIGFILIFLIGLGLRNRFRL